MNHEFEYANNNNICWYNIYYICHALSRVECVFASSLEFSELWPSHVSLAFELSMPSSAAGKSFPSSAPDPPPGVDLPADYVAKRCRRCGLLGIFLGSVGFRSSIRSCNGEKRRRLASPLILPCPKKDKSIPGLQT